MLEPAELPSRPGRLHTSSGWLPAAALFLIGALGLAASLLVRQTRPSGLDYEIVFDQPMWAMHAGMHGASSGMMSSSGQQAQPAGLAPAAEVPEQFFDFGALAGAKEASHSFILANRGSAPLIVTRAYTTCGCTTAEISAAVIPPGKAGLVTVYFQPVTAAGGSAAIRRGIILETNDPRQPLIELWVQAALSSSSVE